MSWSGGWCSSRYLHNCHLSSGLLLSYILSSHQERTQLRLATSYLPWCHLRAHHCKSIENCPHMRPVSDHMRPVSYRQNRAHNGWRQSLSKLYSFGTRLFMLGLEMIHIPILRGWDNMRHWHWQIESLRNSGVSALMLLVHYCRFEFAQFCTNHGPLSVVLLTFDLFLHLHDWPKMYWKSAEGWKQKRLFALRSTAEYLI